MVKNKLTTQLKKWIALGSMFLFCASSIFATSHREAPLIANDPLADNTDLYAFRSPDDPNTITIIANYIPMQLPHGGPNYTTFGTDIRYEIHIDNDASIPGDEIIYRFTFNQVNEDPSTFFNIRLGLQNLKTTYTMERSMDGGASFTTVITNGIVPPNNIGPRSIESGAGLGTTYGALMEGAINTTGNGEKVFAGPVDDPFFVDLGGIFDLGNASRQDGDPRDGLACYNVSTIAIQVPISMLLKDGAPSTPTNILDADYVIGIWASASRQAVRTFTDNGVENSGDWVQVSRIGMPLTNEAVIPIGSKDYWNSITPYEEIAETTMDGFFFNPELALYMDDDQFGSAVPAFAQLRIQKAALGSFDFSNGGDGLYGLKGSDAVAGTALDDAVFGTLLLPGPGMPRSVDLWPAFHTGVPNVIPYQLATGKDGNPLAAGKPFINNFLPNGGDMLRLNMAVPVTARTDENFSSLGIVNAAVLGLTNPIYASSADLQFIPNMDGFPNGRRLEDDVTRIELQAVAGVVLAAVGLWYDDFDGTNPVSQDLIDVLSYTTGVESNDVAFQPNFPYLAMPFSGTGECSGKIYTPLEDENPNGEDPMAVGQIFASSNTQGMVGVFDLLDDNAVAMSMFPSAGTDADGIFYNADTDQLMQLNRTDNVINTYSDVNLSLAAGETPMVTNTSSSDFTNGREIAVTANKIVVAQDAAGSNNDMNRLLVYNLDGTLDKTYDVGINLWGIHIDGNTLFAIVDNSSQLAVFNNFFSNAEGMITPSSIVDIEGIVRTHGITYYAETDMMLLTDVGAASSATDGAFTIVKSYSTAAADGTVSLDEQIRVEGDATFLGNPVDIAFDAALNRIFIAERANNGGRILGYEMPMMSGNFVPAYNKPFAGASALYFTDNVGGNSGPSMGVDLELSISTPSSTYGQYVEVPYTITLTNNGDMDATGISVSAGIPTGLVFTSADATAGTYDLGTGRWMVPALAAGQSANLVLTLFTLDQVASVTSFTQIVAQDQTDADSSPANNTTITPSEDDEAVTSINITGNSGGGAAGASQLFASSNNQGKVGVFNLFDDGVISMSAFDVAGMDADGIAYNDSEDRLFQLNRSNNVVDIYDNVNFAVSNGNELQVAQTSTSDFTNGREIAVVDNWILVAQDAADSNGNENKLFLYLRESQSISLVRTFDVSINLWGIHASGNDLFAIVDNSNQLAFFSDFFSKPSGPIEPTEVISVDGLVRTHGITYDAASDLMLLTDVGAASSATDGAVVVINNYMAASTDGVISMSEQIRIAGSNTFLGNPVDIAYDVERNRIFVAERANEGGRIIGYEMPVVSGNQLPIYNLPFMGASAIYYTGNEAVSAMAQADSKTISGNDLKVEAQIGMLYPTPALNNVTASIQSESSGMINLMISDSQGRVVMHKSHEMFEGQNDVEIDISKLNAGFYFLNIVNENAKIQKQSTTHRILKID